MDVLLGACDWDERGGEEGRRDTCGASSPLLSISHAVQHSWSLGLERERKWNNMFSTLTSGNSL